MEATSEASGSGWGNVRQVV